MDEELKVALAKIKLMIIITLQDQLSPKLNVLAVVSQTPSYSPQFTNTAPTPVYFQQ